MPSTFFLDNTHAVADDTAVTLNAQVSFLKPTPILPYFPVLKISHPTGRAAEECTKWCGRGVLSLHNDYPSLAWCLNPKTVFSFLIHEASSCILNMLRWIELQEKPKQFFDQCNRSYPCPYSSHALNPKINTLQFRYIRAIKQKVVLYCIILVSSTNLHTQWQ